MKGQSLAAPGAEADIIAQSVEKNLVNFISHPLPCVVEPVLIHRASKGLGKREVKVQLSVVQLQRRQGGLILGQTGLFQFLLPLPAAQQMKEKLPQGIVRLVKGDIGGSEFLLPGEDKAQLPQLCNNSDIAGDIQLAVGLCRGHLVPLGEHLQQVKVYLQHQVGEAGHSVLQRRNHRLQSGPDDSKVLGGPHITFAVHSEPAGPAGDLLDLLRLQLPALHAIILLCVHKNDPTDGQIQAHADGVGGDDIFHFTGQKALHLFAPCGVGEGTVDNSRFLAALAKILCHTEHPNLGEGDESVSRLDPLVVDDAGHTDQGSGTLVLLYLPAVAAAVDQPQEEVFGFRRGAQVDLRSQNTQDGSSPGVAPLAVSDHLTLINDCHIVAPLQVQLFGGGRHVGVIFPQVLLLASGKGTGHPGVQQSLLGLQGQQTQGSQVDPGFRLDQALEAGVGLAGVSAPQVKDEAAAHRPSLRVLVLWIEGDKQREAGADGLGDIPNGPYGAQALPEQLGAGKALSLQHSHEVSFRLGGGEFFRYLPGDGVKHLGIAGKGLPGKGMIGALTQPGGGAEEVVQDWGELFAGAAVLQGKKLFHRVCGLGRTEHPASGCGEQTGQNSAVVVSSQQPGRRVVPGSVLPGLGKKGAGVADSCGDGPADSLRLVGIILAWGEGGILFRPEHLLLPPHAGGVAAPHHEVGLGEQLLCLLIGPAPLF